MQKVKQILIIISKWVKQNIFRPLLEVDLQILGLTRILLGIVCLFDIARRMPYIEILFYPF